MSEQPKYEDKRSLEDSIIAYNWQLSRDFYGRIILEHMDERRDEHVQYALNDDNTCDMVTGDPENNDEKRIRVNLVEMLRKFWIDQETSEPPHWSARR